MLGEAALDGTGLRGGAIRSLVEVGTKGPRPAALSLLDWAYSPHSS